MIDRGGIERAGASSRRPVVVTALRTLAGLFVVAAGVAVVAAGGPAAAACYSLPLTADPVVQSDTLRIRVDGLPTELADMKLRLRGLDAPVPDYRAKCALEIQRATAMAKRVRVLLDAASKRQYCDPKWDRWPGQIIADVTLDGKSLTATLIAEGLGRKDDGGYHGNWCRR